MKDRVKTYHESPTISGIVQEKLDKRLVTIGMQLETGWIDKAPTYDQVFNSVLKMVTTDPKNRGVSGWHYQQIKAELKRQMREREFNLNHD